MGLCRIKENPLRVALLAVALSAVSVSVWAAPEATFMDPQGPAAIAQKAHLIRVTLITMIAVLPVLVLVPWLLWRYRYRNTKARYTPDWEFSPLLDLVMWGVPLVIIAVLSAQLWSATTALDPYRPIDPAAGKMKIQVIGLDWKWLFIYPELGIATVGEVAFPVAEPVDFELTSDTVMQSFIISALAGQIYVMPGMTTAVNVEAMQAGVFEGENMQYNGTGFAEQKFKAQAMSRADFTAWVEKVRSQGVILDAKTFETLSQLSTKVQAQAAIGAPALPGGIIYFSNAPADLFGSVRNQYHSGHAQTIAQPPAGAFKASGHSHADHTLSP